MSQIAPSLCADRRRQFHAIFGDWLVNAPLEELEQLDSLMDRHPPHQVRSMLSFIRECLGRTDLRPQLPANLLLRLQAVNWPQGGFVARVA